MAKRVTKISRKTNDAKSIIDGKAHDVEALIAIVKILIDKVDSLNDDIAELFSLHARR